MKEKQLLLKDVCSRIPYNIRYKGDGGWGVNPHQHTTSLCTILTSKEPLVYLRPMSSMTEEEKKEFDKFVCIDILAWEGDTEIGYENQAHIMADGIDWLLEHHFDFRGLIKKGLALEAPEGIYKND